MALHSFNWVFTMIQQYRQLLIVYFFFTLTCLSEHRRCTGQIILLNAIDEHNWKGGEIKDEHIEG